jgi:hypothetical protein
MMLVIVISVVILAAILISLGRTLAADAYGLRPPLRSHHGEEILDQWVTHGIQPGSHRAR